MPDKRYFERMLRQVENQLEKEDLELQRDEDVERLDDEGFRVLLAKDYDQGDNLLIDARKNELYMHYSIHISPKPRDMKDLDEFVEKNYATNQCDYDLFPSGGGEGFNLEEEGYDGILECDTGITTVDYPSENPFEAVSKIVEEVKKLKNLIGSSGFY